MIFMSTLAPLPCPSPQSESSSQMMVTRVQKVVYSNLYSQAVTHPSTNLAQCCLTTVIRQELVLSTWYGRRHRKSHAILLSNSYPVAKEGLSEGGKRIRIAYSTEYSQAVTHPSTNSAQSCLTAVIRQELVCSTWYGCRHLKCVEKLFLKRTF